MIVRRDDLSVFSVADEVLKSVCGGYCSEVEMGKIAWSNELVMHVIEMKTNGPAKTLDDLPGLFLTNVQKINKILEPLGGMLLPSGAHPFMNPDTEAVLWKHEYNEIYEMYNRIFDCRGHGWVNVQSTHLNLPFANDKEFARLHAATRLILPLIPALTASTPIIEGKITGFLDTRLEYYQNNQKKIPSISGLIIPERVYSKNEYQKLILDKMYKDISTYDPAGVLQQEWLNSRGAIARFDRSALEIRILDMQECPLAEIAVISFIIKIIKALIAEGPEDFEKQCRWQEGELQQILNNVVKKGSSAIIDNRQYLRIFDLNKPGKVTVKELLEYLLDALYPRSVSEDTLWRQTLQTIITCGSLSERILCSLGEDLSRKNQQKVYYKLAECLHKGELFQP